LPPYYNGKRNFPSDERRNLPMASKDPNQPAGAGEGKRKAMKESASLKSRAYESQSQGLDARSQEAIGRSLKAHYEDLVRAPVPGKFLEMLDRLEKAERSKPGPDGDDAG
jgi:hypothetical protein